MSTAAVPMLFNALNGAEVKEIILRKVRAAFEDDTRFRQSTTYPNLQFTFTLGMKYEPGNNQQVIVNGKADATAKLQAQQDVIANLEAAMRDRDEKFRDIEQQAALIITENEKLKFELKDANDFIQKLHADKQALLAARDKPAAVAFTTNPVYNLDAIANGGEIVVAAESEVLDEPDKLRESGETEPIEIEFTGGGEAVGDLIPVSQTIGKPPGAVVLKDDQGVAYNTRDIQPARGATVESGKPPAGVKGRPRG